MEKPTKEQLHEEARKRQEVARAEQEHQEKQLEKDAAKQAWLADGGEAAEFEQHWPEMRRRIREERVRAAGDAARDAHFRQTHASF